MARRFDCLGRPIPFVFRTQVWWLVCLASVIAERGCLIVVSSMEDLIGL